MYKKLRKYAYQLHTNTYVVYVLGAILERRPHVWIMCSWNTRLQEYHRLMVVKLHIVT